VRLFTERHYQVFFLCFLFLYTSILVVYHITGLSLMKGMANMMAVTSIVYTLLSVFTHSFIYGVRKWPFFLLLLVVFFISIHTLINFGNTDFVDLLKFFSLFLFSFVGIGMRWQFFYIPRALFYLMFLAPFFVEVLGGSKIYYSGVGFGFLPNNNTAVMYYVVLISIFLSQYKKDSRYSISFALVAILFQKLGSILSVAFSLIFVYFNKVFKYLPIIFISSSILFFFFYYFGFLDRIFEVLGGLLELYTYNSISDVSSMSYGQIAIELGSTDLSAVFRMKHWSEILSYYQSLGFSNYLFGFGARYSMIVTTEGLMPHSDIIRVLCELGLLLFVLFLTLYFYLYTNLKCVHLKTALLVVFLYYFTENLIDNFISMYLLHLIVGSNSFENNNG